MQFCQPPFQPTGFPSYGQPCGLNTPNFQPLPNQINGCTNIIGEGNVVTVISPDGSAQVLFFPTFQWPHWRTFPQYPFTGNMNNPQINTLGAWFVRNIFNPIQPSTPLYQSLKDCFSMTQYPRASASDFSLNLAPPGLPLKFHNDKCTSTTDMHYFIPKQFSWFRRQTGCVAVQVAAPVATATTVCDGEISCAKPCNCRPVKPCNCTAQTEQNQHVKCFCIKNSNSKMSIDSISENRKRNEKRRKSKRTKSNKTHKCECNEPSSSDKCVTTFADQGTDCASDREQETQMSCGNSVILIKSSEGACNSMCHRAKIWSPVPCSSKHSSSQSTVSSQQCMNISDSCTSCTTSGTDH